MKQSYILGKAGILLMKVLDLSCRVMNDNSPLCNCNNLRMSMYNRDNPEMLHHSDHRYLSIYSHGVSFVATAFASFETFAY